MSEQYANHAGLRANGMVSGLSRLKDGQGAFLAVTCLFIALGWLFLPVMHVLSLEGLVLLARFVTAMLAIALTTHLFVHFKATGSIDKSLAYLRCEVLSLANLMRALPTVLLIKLFLLTFSSFKANIPEINPFSWDPAFAALDKMLHFGAAPWKTLSRLTGYGMFTLFIDNVYYVWFPVVFVSAAVAVTAPGNGKLRHQFLLSFILCWLVIGCLAAALLSSAGPIFYDEVTGGADYSGLVMSLERLHGENVLNTILLRNELWHTHVTAVPGFVNGISAMPSMHNSMCVLLLLAALRIGRWLALAAGSFALLIFIGSVHLGWHYAVDGYLAAALTGLIWKVSGMIAEGRFQPRCV
jgi:hypothetical protein